MTKPNELVALGMAPQLAKRISDGISAASGIKPQASIADVTEAPTASDFNALLDALRAAGILAQPA